MYYNNNIDLGHMCIYDKLNNKNYVGRQHGVLIIY